MPSVAPQPTAVNDGANDANFQQYLQEHQSATEKIKERGGKGKGPLNYETWLDLQEGEKGQQIKLGDQNGSTTPANIISAEGQGVHKTDNNEVQIDIPVNLPNTAQDAVQIPTPQERVGRTVNFPMERTGRHGLHDPAYAKYLKNHSQRAQQARENGEEPVEELQDYDKFLENQADDDAEEEEEEVENQIPDTSNNEENKGDTQTPQEQVKNPPTLPSNEAQPVTQEPDEEEPPAPNSEKPTETQEEKQKKEPGAETEPKAGPKPEKPEETNAQQVTEQPEAAPTTGYQEPKNPYEPNTLNPEEEEGAVGDLKKPTENEKAPAGNDSGPTEDKAENPTTQPAQLPMGGEAQAAANLSGQQAQSQQNQLRNGSSGQELTIVEDEIIRRVRMFALKNPYIAAAILLLKPIHMTLGEPWFGLLLMSMIATMPFAGLFLLIPPLAIIGPVIAFPLGFILWLAIYFGRMEKYMNAFMKMGATDLVPGANAVKGSLG